MESAMFVNPLVLLVLDLIQMTALLVLMELISILAITLAWRAAVWDTLVIQLP